MMDIIKVGQNIAKMRRENNLTQEKLAEKLNLSAPAVSRWENGHSWPDITLLPELARIFDCTIDHILMADRRAADTIAENDIQANLLEQIINFIDGRNMIGMNNQSIIKAFSTKHGNLGDVKVIRNRSTRYENNIINSITLRVNGKEYNLLEKILFGDMTELYRAKLLCDFGISVPLIYKIDFQEKCLLLEDLSEDYISGREYDEDTHDGEIYRNSYDDIMNAVAQFHLAFWENEDAFKEVKLPWNFESVENFRMHADGMGRDLETYIKMFPDKLSEHEIQCFKEALDILKKEMPAVIEGRFNTGKNITIIHGDLNPSNVFVSRKDKGNVKLIDLEAVRIGLATDDIAMFLALHAAPDGDENRYLNQYYSELTKKIDNYSIDEFMKDFKLSIMNTMFHPIGIVGVRMNIYDEHMIKSAIRAYEIFVKDKNI